MAVEKLILRSILYGADKIPDSWFEKIPGGFYKDKDGNLKKETASGDKKVVKPDPRDGRRAKQSDFRNEGYRSEDDRRRQRGRDRDRDRDRDRTRASSYDGGDDDEEYYHYNRDGKPGRSKSHRRQRSLERDRQGYHGGYRREWRDESGRKPDDRYDDKRGSDRRPLATDPEYNRRRSVAYRERPLSRSDGRTAGFATAAGAAVIPPSPLPSTEGYQRSMPFPMSRPQTSNDSISSGYVPYADIYGYPDQRPQSQHIYSTTRANSPSPNPMDRTQSAAAVLQDPQRRSSTQQAPTDVVDGARSGYYNRRSYPRNARDGQVGTQFTGYESPRAYGRSDGQYQSGRDHSRTERYVDPGRPLSSQMGAPRQTQYSHRASAPLSLRGQLLTSVLLDGTDTSLDRILTEWSG